VREDRRGDWMQTFTGKVFWPMDPVIEDIDITDIAHALANACRFAGHTIRFYSVAEHSVLMARALVNPELQRWALLHDATEAYLVDVPRPVKPFLVGYREAEAALMAAVAARFGLAGEMPDLVKSHDNRILIDERAQAMTYCRRDWNLEGAPLGVTLRFWSPAEAEREFMITFRELFGFAPPARVPVKHLVGDME